MFRKIIYLIFFVSVLWLTAVQARASDIAFYVGGWNSDGWYSDQQFADVDTIILQTGHLFGETPQFDDSQAAAFGTWVEEHTDNDQMDILWLNGCMPNVLYPLGNTMTEGSRIELFLDSGNMIINIGDWFGYCSYECTPIPTRCATQNADGGAANILDLDVNIIAGEGHGQSVVTATGTQYLPSLNQVESIRPFELAFVTGDWEVAAIFAQDATGAWADPAVIHNRETGGYLAIINQSTNWITDRGQVCAELIGNWVAEVIGLYNPYARAPNPADHETDVSVDTHNICWSPGEDADYHEIYFGTDPCNFVVGEPNATQLVGNDCYAIGDPNLVASTTYYWQIVEVNDKDYPIIVKYPGAIWDFTTISGKATVEFPAHRALIDGSMKEFPKDSGIWYLFTTLNFWLGDTTNYTDYSYQIGYFSENEQDVIDRVEGASLGWVLSIQPVAGGRFGTFYAGHPQQAPPHNQGLERAKAYYWAVDGTDYNGNTFPGDVWQFTIQDVKAFEPYPANDAVFMPTDVLLTWLEGYGMGALGHDVYISTSWDDVNNAYFEFDPPDGSGASPEHKAFREHDANYPCEYLGLANSTTFYWRIDEVWGRVFPVDPFEPGNLGEAIKGDVWCFSTEPPNVGTIREDLWWDIPGGIYLALLYADPRFPGNPDATKFLNSFDTGPNKADNYGGMIHGWLHIVESGDYTFWLCADDQAELFLSTDETPANRRLLANESGSRGPLTWGFGGEEESAPISLVGGQKYYIRACYKEGGGNDHCQVAWQGPEQPLLPVDGQNFAVIPGSRLSPFVQLWAHSPDPNNGQIAVPTAYKLRWGPGEYADKHDVYFSTDKALVESRDASVSMGLIDANEILIPSLSKESLYYWAIDEVNEAGPDPCEWKGELWRFRTERAPGFAGGVLGLYYHWWPAIVGVEPPPREPYFRERDLVMSRIDPNVDWNWGDGSPDPSVNVDGFSIRWVGHIECPIDADYTFATETDDGVRLFINGQEIISAWQQQGMTWYSGGITLTAGLHDIDMHMYEHGGGAGARLAWSAIPLNPLDDLPIPQQIIPSFWLWPRLWAYSPKPSDGEIIGEREPALDWMPGYYAYSHELYFSTSFDDVNDRSGDALVYVGIDPCYPYPALPPLDLDTEYFWLVDEVGLTERWDARSVWSFRTDECLTVDNMEDHNDRGEMRDVWIDGFANTKWNQQTWELEQGGNSGSNLRLSSAVGSPSGVTGPIHDGYEAMALYYDNDNSTYPPVPGEEHFVYDTGGNYWSEIEANTTGLNSLDFGEDWTGQGIKSLSLYFTGHPKTSGSYVYIDGIAWTVHGYGRDIGGRHDEFYGVLMELTGDGTVLARVASVEKTHPSAKAGVMIRDKLTPYSSHAFVCVTPGTGVSFQRRLADGGVTTEDQITGTAPHWVKLVRSGNWLYASHANDVGGSPDYFSSVGDAQIIMDPNVYIGFAVTSHSEQEICTASFEQTEVSYNDPIKYHIGPIGTNDPEKLWVALEDNDGTVAVVEHDDVNALTYTTWKPWYIRLTDFIDLDFNSVKKVYVGVGDRGNTTTSGGSGCVYIDDIRICPPVCVPEWGPKADFTDDCKVDYEDLSILTDEWLIDAHIGEWEYRAAYWDARYPTAWAEVEVTEAVRDYLVLNGYTLLDADELKAWMLARIADKALSVVVFCKDIVPDTVAETMDASCTIRQYLNAGGKVVWYSDWPFYYQGLSNGTSAPTWGPDGAINILGFDASGGTNDTGDEVFFTAAGIEWGLTQTWNSGRATPPDITENLTVLATINDGSAAAWAKHYLPGDNCRGFVRVADFDVTPTSPPELIADLLNVAEYRADGTLTADLHKDDVIDLKDYAKLAKEWLAEILFP